MKPGPAPGPLPQPPARLVPVKNLPAAPPRRRISEKVSLEDQAAGRVDRTLPAVGEQPGLPSAPVLSPPPPGTSEQGQEAVARAGDPGSVPEPPRKVRQPPVPPPRRKRISRQLVSGLPSPVESTESSSMKDEAPQKPTPGAPGEGRGPASCARTQSPQAQAGSRPQSSAEFKGSLASLSDSLGASALAADQDSYSTSSTEEEPEHLGSAGKKKPSVILGKARHRLSFVSFTNVFHAFLSNDRKLYKKVVELAQDKASYFGNLVQDYKVYSLEMMARQTSSTEMLQEIRTMMTQLKSYLLQSTELKALVDPALHPEEELGQSWVHWVGAGAGHPSGHSALPGATPSVVRPLSPSPALVPLRWWKDVSLVRPWAPTPVPTCPGRCSFIRDPHVRSSERQRKD